VRKCVDKKEIEKLKNTPGKDYTEWAGYLFEYL
jgi:hypothetical protein